MVHLQYSLAFLISPHGIAMPIKGLYFTSVVSIFFFLLSFFFSTLNLWGQWTDLNQMDTYSLMTAIWKIWSELPLAYSPHGLGQNRFLGPTLNFDRTYLCNGTWHQQWERNLSIHRDSPTWPTFGEFWPQKGWERLASFYLPTLKFLHWRHCQPYRMDVI